MKVNMKTFGLTGNRPLTYTVTQKPFTLSIELIKPTRDKAIYCVPNIRDDTSDNHKEETIKRA